MRAAENAFFTPNAWYVNDSEADDWGPPRLMGGGCMV